MWIKRKNLSGLSLAALTLIWCAPSAALHIMLDPGHGGVDTGAVYGAAREAELVLKVAHRLQFLLEKDPSFKVTMTRTTDKVVPLPARVKMAEQAKADLFVSLHANAASDQRAKGVEFFFQNHLAPDEESLFLASQENQLLESARERNEISGGEDLSKKGDVAAIVEDLRRQNRMNDSLRLTKSLASVWSASPMVTSASIKQAPFYVISKTSMPSVLIEIGFLTNPREAKSLLTADYQRDLAKKIYNALLAYKEKMQDPSAKSLN